MDGYSNNVVCCFCGDSLPLENAIILNVQPNSNSEEVQKSFAHKQHFTEKIIRTIPLHPDFFDEK